MGASLQTLHEEKFDHGIVLSQTPAPGLKVIQHSELARVNRKLAIECADLLIQGLRDGVHVPPLVDVGWKAKELEGKPLEHAPKITKADMEIDWANWTPTDWARRLKIKHGVWSTARARKGKGNLKVLPRRVIFHDVKEVPLEEVWGRQSHMEWIRKDDPNLATFRTEVVVNFKNGDLFILLPRGVWVKVHQATAESEATRLAGWAVLRFLRKDVNGHDGNDMVVIRGGVKGEVKKGGKGVQVVKGDHAPGV